MYNPKGSHHQYVAFIMSANLEDPEVATWLENVSLHSNSKKVSTKDCANHWEVALIPDPTKVMIKILQIGFSIMWTKNFQISKLGSEKEEVPEIELPAFTGS